MTAYTHGQRGFIITASWHVSSPLPHLSHHCWKRVVIFQVTRLPCRIVSRFQLCLTLPRHTPHSFTIQTLTRVPYAPPQCHRRFYSFNSLFLCLIIILLYTWYSAMFILQCLDAAGWATGREGTRSVKVLPKQFPHREGGWDMHCDMTRC